MRTAILLCAAALQAAAAVHVEMPYRTIDGMELKLDLAVPDNGPGPHPVIVCLHGGGWSMGSKGSFRKYLPQFAEKGYAAAAIQYALAPARPFPAPIADTYAAVAYLRANAKRWNLDPTRISLLGTSAGAHLVLLAGFDNKANVEAIIDVSGPADLRDWHMLPPAEKGLAALGTNSATLLSQFLAGANPADASPVLQVRSGAPPVLVFHWKEDQAVEASQAQRLIAALEKAGIKHEAIWFEGRGHALSGKGVEEIVPRTVAFLNALKK